LVSPSARVVYAALAGDLAVAAAKFGAFALSGSTAMLTEAIHSLVDPADQLLLLTGQSRMRWFPSRPEVRQDSDIGGVSASGSAPPVRRGVTRTGFENRRRAAFHA
jgi:hypothetical protein